MTDLADGNGVVECASRVGARCGSLIDPSVRCPLCLSRGSFPGFALARSASPPATCCATPAERRSPDACRIAPYLLWGARRGSRPPGTGAVEPTERRTPIRRQSGCVRGASQRAGAATLSRPRLVRFTARKCANGVRSAQHASRKLRSKWTAVPVIATIADGAAALRSCGAREDRSGWWPGAEWTSDLPLVAKGIDNPAKAPAVLVADA